jgi:hypothetical protein
LRCSAERAWIDSLEQRVLLAAFHPMSNAADGSAESLRAAFVAANANGEDDVITLGAGTYRLTSAGAGNAGDLDATEVGRTLTLQGAGRDQTVIDANDIDRALDVAFGVTVVVRDLTIRNGRVSNANGGAIYNLGDLTLVNAAVRDSAMSFSTTGNHGGGGIFNSGTLRLRNTEVTGNTVVSGVGGGGIFSTDSGQYNTGALQITEGSVISGNVGDTFAHGGGVYQLGGTLLVDRSIIRNNRAALGGGLSASVTVGTVATISNTQVLSNSGGGIYNAGHMAVRGSSVSQNTFGTGTPPATASPGSGTSGAGINNEDNGVLTIENSTIANNRGATTGGGIRNHVGSTLTVRRSTISGNYGNWGGGLWNDIGGTATFYNSTLSGNLARAGGGGINTAGTLHLENVTVTNNRSDYASQLGPRIEGGGILRDRGIARVFNSIVVGNFSGGGGGNHNASQAQDAITFSGLFTGVGNIFGQGGTGLPSADNRLFISVAAAGLDPVLKDNGGPTLTHVLLPGSPGVDGGRAEYTPFTDQRGYPINGPVDVGAYELQGGGASDWSYRVSDASQFGPGQALVHGFGFDDGTPNADAEPVFLGFEFDTGSLVLGKIVEGLFGDKYGGQLRLDLSGRFGIEIGFYVNSGSLDVDYDGLLNYVVDPLGDGTFSVNSFLTVDDGALYTISPKIGAYADLVLELDARIGATAAFIGTIGGDVNFKIDERLELFSLNRQEVDEAGNPQFYQDGTPILDGDIRFAFDQLIEDLKQAGEEITEADRDRRAARQYQKANEEERDGEIEMDQGKRDLENAKTQQERDAAQQRIAGGQSKVDDARTRRTVTTADVVKRKLGVTSGLGVNFSEAAGSLLGVDARLTAGLGVDGVASATKEIGTFTVTLPDVNLTDREPDFRGNLSASTDMFTDPLQDAKRQLAKLAIDVGGLLGPLIGLPTGKYNANLGGGLLDLTVQTVSYNLIPTLNVTQDVLATPYARKVEYAFERPLLVDLGDGGGYVLRSTVIVDAGTAFKIDPGDANGDGVPDPVRMTPTLTLANRFTNEIGLDIDIDGALEAFALELKVLDQSVVDIGPLITHNHRIGSVPLGNVFERTFDLSTLDGSGNPMVDESGNPIVFRGALAPFTIREATSDGASPATALTGTPDAADPDVTRVTVDVQTIGLSAPLFIEAPMTDADAGEAFRTVEFAGPGSSGDYIRSLIVLDEDLIVTALGGTDPGALVPLPLTIIPLEGGVEYRFDPDDGGGIPRRWIVSGFQDAQAGTTVDTAVVGMKFTSAGEKTITATRLDPIALVDLTDVGVGVEGVDQTAVEQNTARVVLNTLDIDVDGDGASSPMTDGILIIRYLQGLRGDALVQGAVNPAGTRTTPQAVLDYIEDELAGVLDVDDDGTADAATDGVLIARHMAGFTGTALTGGAVNSAGGRTDPAQVRDFLRGSRITATNDQVVLLDENGNPTTSSGTGFDVPAVVDTGGDPFGLEGATDPAPNATPGSSSAAPADVTPGAAPVAGVSGFSVAAAPAVLEYELSTFGRVQTYDELYLKDAQDPNDPSKRQLVSSVAAGSPMRFGGTSLADLLDRNEVQDLSARLVKESRNSTLGVDEPIFIKVPDAAGYTYQAMDGLAFKTLDIDPEFGGNLYLDRQFDLYLFNPSALQWQYETTITAGERYAFPGGGVEQFQLFGLALPNETLHRGSNRDAPELLTTTGFTLAAPAGISGTPRVMAMEEAPRNRLSTPDDAVRPVCTGVNCPFAFDTDAEFRIVRNGAAADVFLTRLDSGASSLLETFQLASATDIIIQGDQHFDRLVIDTSGGPIRVPIIFHGGNNTFGGPDELLVTGTGAGIDLTGRDRITGVEQIDIRGTGANTLRLDLDAVQNNAGTQQTLIVLADADDTVQIGSGWALSHVEGSLSVFAQAGATLKLSTVAPPAAAPQAAPATANAITLTAEDVSERTDGEPEAFDQPMVVEAGSPPLLQTAASTGSASQVIAVVPSAPYAAPGAPLIIGLDYAAGSLADSNGLHLRLHYDSSTLAFDSLSNLMPDRFSAYQLLDDAAGGGLDGDPATDKYVNFLWFDPAGDWPTPNLPPFRLVDVQFIGDASFTGRTIVRFSGTSTPGSSLEADPAELSVSSARPRLVNGTSGDDTITLTESDGDLVLMVNGASARFPLSDVLRLEITGGGGADTLVVPAPLALDLVLHGNFQLHSGAGIGSLRLGEESTLRLLGSGQALSLRRHVHAHPTAVLDLGDNDLILRADPGTRDDAAGQVLEMVRNGRNTGAWNGPGINSSAAAVRPFTGLVAMRNPGIDTFAGADVDASSILVKYTYNGDATLDGKVNADDYFRIDSAFLSRPANPLYADGDFNYDGQINADDYFLIDSAFLGQGEPLASSTSATATRATGATVRALPAEPQQARERKRPVRSIFSDRPVSVLGASRRQSVARRR